MCVLFRFTTTTTTNATVEFATVTRENGATTFRMLTTKEVDDLLALGKIEREEEDKKKKDGASTSSSAMKI